MKRLIKKTKGLIKGTPSAVLVSAVIHLILLSVAGGLVVFSVIQKSDKKFVPPPPVERPKMKLKKPQVKLKKNVKPGSVSRISSKSVANMPDMQLPPLEGMGAGLGQGLSGFEMMPDISKMNLFGGTKSLAIGNDFEGTFYAIGLDRRGKKNGVLPDDNSYYDALKPFFDSDWNPRALSRFYRWPQKLYTTFFYIPMSFGSRVPRGFGIPDDVYTEQWACLYSGKIMSKEGGRYRFWAAANNLLAVRVDGKEVVHGGHLDGMEIYTDWRSSSEEDRKYYRGQKLVHVGDWFELKPEVPVKMEVIFGDRNGRFFSANLTIQKEGVEYPKNRAGMPVLPVFKTAEIPQYQIDEIQSTMIEGEADLFDPTTFNVY